MKQILQNKCYIIFNSKLSEVLLRIFKKITKNLVRTIINKISVLLQIFFWSGQKKLCPYTYIYNRL